MENAPRTKRLYGSAKARPGEPLDLRCECCGSVLVARAVHLLDLPTGTVGTYGVDCAARLQGWIKPGEKLGVETDKFLAEANFVRISSLGEPVEEGVAEAGGRKYRFKRYSPEIEVLEVGGRKFRIQRYERSRASYRYSTQREASERDLAAMHAARGERVLWTLFWGGAVYIDVAV